MRWTMKRIINFIIVFSVLFSAGAYAGSWTRGSTSSEYVSSGIEPDCSVPIGVYVNQGSAVYEQRWSTDKYKYCTFYHWYPAEEKPPTESLPADTPVYNMLYTDEQCEATYGVGSTTTGVMEDGSGVGCNVPEPLSPADEQCQALTSGGANFLTLPYNPGSSFEWSSGGCKYKTSALWLETPSGEFSAMYEATEAVDDAMPVEEVEPEPVMPQTGTEVSSSFTETSDASTDCPMSNVSYGGTTYCYDGSAGSSDNGIDFGSDDDGTTTAPDGSPLGAGEGDPDGDGQGDSTSGDIVAAIQGLKTAMRNGFDGLLEKLIGDKNDTIKAMGDNFPSDGQLEQTFGDADTIMGEALDGASSTLTEQIDGSGSGELDSLYGRMKGFFGSYFPEINSGTCTPLIFGEGEMSYTIECDIFDKIKAALGFIFYALTAYVILSTMFSARPA